MSVASRVPLFAWLLVSVAATGCSSPPHPDDMTMSAIAAPPRPENAYPCDVQADDTGMIQVPAEGDSIWLGRHLLYVPPRDQPGNRPFRMRLHQGDYIRLEVLPHGQGNSRGPFELTLSTAGCADPATQLAVARWSGSGWDRLSTRSAGAPPRSPSERRFTVDRDSASSYALIAP